MKIQYLAVIFIIIIMPITIVFSEYINNQITTVQTENSYDAKLLNSTYDAIKAYQLNTINNAISDRPTSKVDDIEAAVTTFFNSLVTSFGYSGYDSSVMNDYVPAVVFCMYDGYYIYSPFVNTLTNLNLENDDGSSTVDEDYSDESLLNGLKPYVYYNCRYVGTNTNGDDYDIVITYTLDNFITIDGTIGGEEVYDSGYLMDGIMGHGSIIDSENGYYEGYKVYNNFVFEYNDTESTKEYLGDTEYYYVKIDGTKFYYSGSATSVDDIQYDDYIFYINDSGEESIQVGPYGKCEGDEKNEFEAYFRAMVNNKDGYIYYRDAYEFTRRVAVTYGLKNQGLTVGNAVKDIDGDGDDEYSFDQDSDTSIFGRLTVGNSANLMEYSTSNFNEHRMQVIENVIKTNLTTAISAYGEYGDASTEYIMPEISDTDWELITNNVCIATFLQGMSIGGKVYNSYSVVANNLTKEYVDENDIYITTTDHTYYKANDKTLLDSTAVTLEARRPEIGF